MLRCRARGGGASSLFRRVVLLISQIIMFSVETRNINLGFVFVD